MTGIDRIQQSKRYLLMQFEDAENEYFTLYDKETDDMRTTKSLYNSLLGRLPLQQEGEHFTIQHDHIVQCHDAYFFQLWNTNGTWNREIHGSIRKNSEKDLWNWHGQRSMDKRYTLRMS